MGAVWVIGAAWMLGVTWLGVAVGPRLDGDDDWW